MTTELFVTGRVCLFGEHSDWAGGYRAFDPTIEPGRCLIAGTDQGIRAEAEPCDDALVFVAADGSERRYPTTPDRLAAFVRSGDFYRHQLGVALAVLEHYPEVRGLRLRTLAQDLPVQKGLSSSAAACVLMARAYSRVYELRLTIEREMDLAYRGERMTGSECGRMDQACAFGRAAVSLIFDGDRMTVERVPVGGPLHLVIADLGAAKDTCRILADLNRCYTSREDRVALQVRQALGPLNAAIHADARACVEAGDARGLGTLMSEGQRIFDALVAPACPAELASPRLHAVLDAVAGDARFGDLVWGGKGVGSQGDGSAQFVARDAAAQKALLRDLPDAFGVTCYPLTLDAGAPAPA